MRSHQTEGAVGARYQNSETRQHLQQVSQKPNRKEQPLNRRKESVEFAKSQIDHDHGSSR